MTHERREKKQGTCLEHDGEEVREGGEVRQDLQREWRVEMSVQRSLLDPIALSSTGLTIVLNPLRPCVKHCLERGLEPYPEPRTLGKEATELP